MVGITVVQAGQLGEQSTFRKYGREFFAKIGARGQEAMRQKYPGMASEWGRKGGRPRKPKLNGIVGQAEQF